jgi:signal transduction histidine kinase
MNLHLDRLDRLMTVTRTEATAIAHDLRTPLSRAWLRLGQAMADIEAGRDAQGALADVEMELQRLGHIFDAILRISRLATAEDCSAFREVAVNRLLGEMQETFGPVAEGRGQTLTVCPARDALAVFTDQGMLSQLLANLVQNAITHCPAGTTISMGAEQAGTRTILTVSDTGPGIPESDRGRVFDLFFRLDPQRTGSGTGIGLALVRALADRLGATVSLSDAGPGLRVEIAFDTANAPGPDAVIRP